MVIAGPTGRSITTHLTDLQPAIANSLPYYYFVRSLGSCLYFSGRIGRCRAVLDDRAWALLRRLTGFLDQFKICFGHRAQVASLTQSVQGLPGNSARKSMQAMLARVTEPVSYQAFQHFITHVPWEVVNAVDAPSRTLLSAPDLTK